MSVSNELSVEESPQGSEHELATADLLDLQATTSEEVLTKDVVESREAGLSQINTPVPRLSTLQRSESSLSEVWHRIDLQIQRLDEFFLQRAWLFWGTIVSMLLIAAAILVMNIFRSPDLSAPAVSAPAVLTPAASTPAGSAPAVSAPAASTPAGSAPAVSAPAASKDSAVAPSKDSSAVDSTRAPQQVKTLPTKVPQKNKRSDVTSRARSEGFLVIASKPSAKIFINGKPLNRTTPVPPSQPIKLAPGNYTVTLAVGAKKYSFPITIKSREMKRLVKTFPTK